MLKNEKRKSEKMWPADCVWPEPGTSVWCYDDGDEYMLSEQDYRACSELEDLVHAKELYDEMEADEEDFGLWDREVENEFWTDGSFDYDAWVDCFCQCMEQIKMQDCDAAYDISEITGYVFGNDNLLRQAFTRRAFAIEYGLEGCSEELEFIGDRVLDYVIVRLMVQHYGNPDENDAHAPFKVRFNEGSLSKIKSHYVCKDYLSERALKLGLDKYILYATADKETDSSREDMMEALIGAIAIDSDWDYDVLEDVVDRLLEPHLETPGPLLEEDYFDILNTWHQKKFGRMPLYEIYRNRGEYVCSVRYTYSIDSSGSSDRHLSDRIDMEADTRSKARSLAAEMAVRTLQTNGLWINIADSGIVPDQDNSINQLQELYQKKYVEQPAYKFIDMDTEWRCDCLCNGICESGHASSKTAAKKQAAYKMLGRLMG